MIKNLFKPKTKDKSSVLIDQFNALMFEFGLYNKQNKTFSLEITKETEHEFIGKLHLEAGLSFHSLDSFIQDIEMYTCCKWNIEPQDFRNYADVKIIKKYFGE